MSAKSQKIIKAARNGKESLAAKKDAQCLKFSRHGVKDVDDFSGLMSSMMSDLIEGKISPQIGNAVCNAGGKLLQAVGMQLRHSKNKVRTTSLQLVG